MNDHLLGVWVSFIYTTLTLQVKHNDTVDGFVILDTAQWTHILGSFSQILVAKLIQHVVLLVEQFYDDIIMIEGHILSVV